MLISLRKKEPSLAVLNQTVAADPSIDESFAESNVSRRFTRKKNNSNEHGRNIRTAKAEKLGVETPVRSKEKHQGVKLSNNFIKTEDLFIRIANTPTKHKNYYTPISSDRATESTNLKSRIQTELALFNRMPSSSKDCCSQMRQQLQLKNGELMILQDEVMRLRRDLSTKQEQFLKSNIRKEKDNQNDLNNLKQEIRILNHEISEKNHEIKQYKKAEVILNREIKSLKYDKLILQKQIQEIYKKRLPKDLKELMSFREISLMKQIEELKFIIEQSKSQNEVKMEAEIRRLKSEYNEQSTSVNKLEVHSRILNRKIVQCENQLKQKTQNFGKYYMNMKQSHNDLVDQLKKSRKENIKLRRLHILSHSHTKKKLHNQLSSSEESLSLSLSSNN